MTSSRLFLAACLLALAGCDAGGKRPQELPGIVAEAGGAASTPGSGGVPGTGGAPGAGTGGMPLVPAGGSGPSLGLLPDGGKEPYAGYDPTVTFLWPQSSTTGGSCKAGHYHGSFIGIYSPGIAVFPAPIPVAGDIDLTLTKSATGEFFDITGGKVSGVADGLFPFSADVLGTLDCSTGKLVNGYLKNGVYLVGPLPASFEGPLVGDYNKLTQAFNNCTWEVGEPTWPRVLYGGSGTWEATWTGP